MQIRVATAADFEQIWPIVRAITEAGEAYALPRDLDEAAARQLWMHAPQRTFVAEMHGRIVGSYYLKPNQAGGGSHVCNCGYAVAVEARGQGVAAAMCRHSQHVARELGFDAMQFNFVVASNVGAVRLWTKLGFETVGRLPRAFRHPDLGLVDALVMYKWLDRDTERRGDS